MPFMIKRFSKWLTGVLVLLLVLTPLAPAVSVYAAEGDLPPPATAPAADLSAEPITVTNSTYGNNPSSMNDIAANQDPKAPQNLRLVSVSHNMAIFEWDFRPKEDDNNIQVWDADAGKWLTWGNYWTRAVTGLSPETTYRIYITWNEDTKQEHKSNVLEFTTTRDVTEYKEAPLTPPSGLKITDVTEDSVTLDWGSSPGATAYDIYVDGAWAGGTWENTATSSTYSPLEAGQTYKFMVGAQRTVNGALETSANSNTVTITWGELAQPEGLQVVTATRSTVSLGWAPVPGATTYHIYQDGVKIGTSEQNRYTVAGLEEGKTYSFKVTGANSLWTSPESDAVTVVPGSNYNNITYYTSWSASTDSNARNLQPDDLDVSKLTHINYAFADICWKKFGSGARACEDPNIPAQNRYVYDGEIVIGDPTFDFQNFKAFESIKAANPHLKLLVSVGGWTWSGNFSNIARTEETRRAFANSAVHFLREYGLDGLDVDWEYPVEGGLETNSRGPEDKENFTLLMKAVREALDAAGSEDGKYYLLTIASGQGDNFTVNADFENSVQYLDFINIMTYDYSGKTDTLGHHNAPLFYDKALPTRSAARNHVLGGLMGHLNGGVPPHKLIVGVPYYGKGWDGCGPNGQYQACKGGSSVGTWESALFDFSHLENDYIGKNGYKRYWNEYAKVPYLYNDQNNVFITYNDETTMMYTASLVKTLDIAGVMSWDISGDRNYTLTNQLVKDLPINGKSNDAALGAPSNLKVSGVTSNSVQLEWDPVEGASTYEVYVNHALSGLTEGKGAYTIQGLQPLNNYKIHVLAVDRTGDEIHRVSSASKQLSITTSGSSSGGSDSSGGSGGSSGSSSAPSPVPQPPKEKDQLDAQVVLSGDKAVITIQVAAAVQAINASDSVNFRIDAGDKAKQAEAEIPQEVIAAVAKKGPNASLSILVNGTEYRIPAALITVAGPVKVSVTAPSEADLKGAEALLKGKEVLSTPLLFKLEQLHADQTATELKHYGKLYVSEFITVDAKAINTKRATGVVYIPGLNELRSVPTLFKVNADGTVTVEIKKTGNGIYVLAQQDMKFKDAIPAWAAEDAAQAAAKWVISGDNSGNFGANKSITRAEIVAIIVRALGLLPDESYTNFADVDPKSAYAGEIAAAKAAGLVKGRTGGTFDPSSPISREELAVILDNVLAYAGMTKDAGASVLDGFKDRSAVSSYAKSAVAMVVKHKIMHGVSTTKFDPKSNVTKAQTVVTVMRTLRTLGLLN
ncbi:glycosyl hydrolase family 18 protein [Paenibacillus lactis]|uniref:chitinase n=1 Tax=Paenibacillus lactis TaxID=228574 RepID=A0ABS4FIL1_9BACL|nr:glycosyl hydrolase family 18 protein [Paenibacillus lactis]MBP1896109.1 chitinase [Paenibacillus lactis]HAF99941.1 glycoside hydrolase [Paenibacillus lactis]